MDSLKPGQIIGDYEVLELLGVGGIARVYRVRHTKTGDEQAIKVLNERRGDLEDRLRQEGRVQSRLQHPNIVRVTGMFDHEGSPVLVMEYVRGKNLEQLIEQRAPMRWWEARPIIVGLLQGVSAAHAGGVLHRDLKPGNILLEEGPAGLSPKLTDFGIAKVLDEVDARDGRTRARAKLGTPGYMAPEQWADAASVDGRADIFAIGVILYELLTGDLPYTGEGASGLLKAIWAGRFTPLETAAPDVPHLIAQGVHKAIQPEPQARFTTADEMLEALGGPIVPPPQDTGKAWWQMGCLASSALALSILVMAAIFAAYAVTQGEGAGAHLP